MLLMLEKSLHLMNVFFGNVVSNYLFWLCCIHNTGTETVYYDNPVQGVYSYLSWW